MTTVAGPQINSISQGVHDFRIVVFNSYQIYVVVAIFFHFVQTATYLFVWGILWFFGVGGFPLFFKKSKRIDIVMIDSAPVALWSVCFPPQWSLTVTICRVLDDVAATHTTSACVYTATRGRKEVD